MRKLIGTIVILVFLYVGFFGCERFNISPFIMEWIKSDKPEELCDNIEKTSKKVKKFTDSVSEKSEGVINNITDK